MVEEGGVKSLWRGNFVNVAKVIPETGVKFMTFETLKNSPFCSKEPTKLERFLCGATAGATAQTFIYPLEVIKTRMVLRSSGQYTGMVNCFMTIWKQV